MSDNEPTIVPPTQLGPMLAPELVARIDQACKLALAKQLNKNETDPALKALADKWRTMDAFSKREIGEPDTVRPEVLSQREREANARQVAPGQKAEVTGPATIYGGLVEIENNKPVP